MTALGASIVEPEAARAAAAAIMSEFVEIDDLQRCASRAIADLTGAEAGFVAASAAAGISHAIAGAITGADLAAVERLPDTAGRPAEVVVPLAHLVHYNAPIEQAVRLTGASVTPFGQANHASAYQLEARLGPQTAAVLFVISHYVRRSGLIGLEECIEVCRARGVPVIVDAAAEPDLSGPVTLGADFVVGSAHKAMAAPTAGLVAGRRDLVRAAYLQNRGICRGTKVGKEGIAGAIAAIEAWRRRDHEAARREEMRRLEAWRELLRKRPGVIAEILPSETNRSLDRLHVRVDPEGAGLTAWGLADALEQGDPPVFVRDTRLDEGILMLDPGNLHPGEAEIVASRLAEELDSAQAASPVATTSPRERRERARARLLRWPDD